MLIPKLQDPQRCRLNIRGHRRDRLSEMNIIRMIWLKESVLLEHTVYCLDISLGHMNYPTYLTEQGFKNLRDQRALCDCILVAQDVSFHVHKSLLASVSDYFRAMFCSGMRESNTNIIPLQGITAEGLNKIIRICTEYETKN